MLGRCYLQRVDLQRNGSFRPVPHVSPDHGKEILLAYLTVIHLMCGTHKKADQFVITSYKSYCCCIIASCYKLIAQRLDKASHAIEEFQALSCLAGQSLLTINGFAGFLKRDQRPFDDIFIEEPAAVDKAFLYSRNGAFHYPEAVLSPVSVINRIDICILIKEPNTVGDILRKTVILKTVSNIRRDPEHSGAYRLHDKFKRKSCSREL